MCTAHSAPLLGVLWGCGGGGGHLETLEFNDCHLSASAVAPPLGAPPEAQASALQGLAFLNLDGCYMEQARFFLFRPHVCVVLCALGDGS